MQDTFVVFYVVTFHELRNNRVYVCVCVAETGGAKNMLSLCDQEQNSTCNKTQDFVVIIMNSGTLT